MIISILEYRKLLENHAYDDYLQLSKWLDEERKKLEDSDLPFKQWQFKNDQLMKLYWQKKRDIQKRSTDLFALQGNIKSKYLYHYTDADSLIGILEENLMYDSGEGISFTTNGNLYKRGFIFWWPGEYSKGKTHENIGIRIKFDYNLMKQNKIKFKKGNEDLGTHEGEEELRCMDFEIPEIQQYIIEVAIFKNKEPKYTQLIQILENMKIKYIKI